MDYRPLGSLLYAVEKSLWSEDGRRLAQRLAELRRDAGLTQVELAERLGVTQSFVTKYETGDRRLDLFQLRAVCRELGVGLTALVTEFDE